MTSKSMFLTLLECWELKLSETDENYDERMLYLHQ